MTLIPMLDVRSAAKNFGSTRAVDGVDLEVHSGEIVTLVGPSGCGKTTTLRLVAGLESLDSGSIFIGGADQSKVPPGKRGVGYVFQDYALFPHLTVQANVEFGLRGLDRGLRSIRSREAIDLVGLSGLEARYPRELSGGQQQRVALARSLAPRPKILLLDEPFSNADPQLRRRLRHELLEIVRGSGVAALWVTHDQDEGMLVADRVVLMREGRVRQSGSPSHIWNHPKDSWVAGFVGRGDLVEGTVAGSHIRTPIGLVSSVGAPEGARVSVLVKPDDLLVCEDGSPATVVRRHFTGSDNIYCLELDGGLLMHVKQPGDVEIPRGTRLKVALAHEDLPYFVEA